MSTEFHGAGRNRQPARMGPDIDTVAVADAAAESLHVSGIGKRFGNTVVLQGVHFSLRPGDALAIIGENGAGKSTLMKVLSGVHRPDAGSMRVRGELYQPRHPADALRTGVAMIHQELSLAPHLSVIDNVMLGQERALGGWLQRRDQRERVRAAMEVLGHRDLDLNRPVGSLPVGIQQLVEIARALVAEARLMIFDEPTSSLTRRDVDRLFEVIDSLRERGVSILYISHFLEEVRRVANRYLVLRDGAQVAEGPLSEVTDRQIVSAMVGRDVETFFPKVPHQIGGPWVRLAGVHGIAKPRGVELTLHRGEILGIAGLVGAGRTELLRCLFGLDPIRRGQIEVEVPGIDGVRRRVLAPGVSARLRSGFGMVSEDRKEEGLAQGLSILENATLSHLAPFTRWGWLAASQRRAAAQELVSSFRVKANSIDQLIRELSGGNQQKVALARLANQRADVLLLDEPTRGIDVGTKAEIYRWMGTWAAEGKAVLMVSSYLPELLGVCDRIAVMSRGRLQEVRPTTQWTEHEILEAAVAGEAE